MSGQISLLHAAAHPDNTEGVIHVAKVETEGAVLTDARFTTHVESLRPGAVVRVDEVEGECDGLNKHTGMTEGTCRVWLERTA